MKLEIYNNATELEERWDYIAGENYFLTRKVLSILEASNPCDAKYYIVDNESIVVVYKLKLNLLTYSSFAIRKNVNIIGIPLSISNDGFVLKRQEHLEYVLKSLKGITVILNTKYNIKGLNRGNTLSTFVMRCPEDSENYERVIRSNYRRRLGIIKNQDIIIKCINNKDFNIEHYKLYENIYSKSNAKLEKQKIEFFKKLDSKIKVFYKNEILCGFIQTKVVKDTLYFIFGGIDYTLNDDGYLYLRMLYEVIEEGINNKCKYINMGQTAEEAKTRFGCNEEELFMYCYSNNRMVNYAVNKLINLASYQCNVKKHNVYKKQMEVATSEKYMGFLGY